MTSPFVLDHVVACSMNILRGKKLGLTCFNLPPKEVSAWQLQRERLHTPVRPLEPDIANRGIFPVQEFLQELGTFLTIQAYFRCTSAGGSFKIHEHFSNFTDISS